MRAETVLVADAAVDALKRNGTVWVVVRRVCEALGLDVVAQRQRLLMAGWASEKAIMMQVEDSLGRPRDTLVIALDAMPMWMASIDLGRVSELARPRLERFQSEARDVLARHFGLDGVAHPTPPAASVSGSAVGSGAPPRTAMSAVQGSGGVLELLAITDQLSGAIRATYAEAQAARATAEQAQAIAAEASAIAAETSDTAVGAQTLARLAMQHAERNAGRGIPAHRRRSAVQHITRQMRAHCASRGLDFKDFFGGVRRELGLRPRTDGGPALSKAAMEPHMIILMARYATNKGVAWCSARTIEDILSGADELTRAGYIDIPTSTPKTVQ
jgi:hypothetical protein